MTEVGRSQTGRMTTPAQLEEAAVLVIGPDHPDSFASNIAAGFGDLGVRAAIVDPVAAYLGNRVAFRRYDALKAEIVRNVAMVQRFLVTRPMEAALRRSQPTLVLCVWSRFTPEQIEHWRRLTPGATWVFWFPDPYSNLGAARILLAPFDYFFFKDPYLSELLSTRTSLPVHFLPEACLPSHHRTELPLDESERRRYECDIAFAGHLYPYRLLVLEGLPSGINLRIYGDSSAEVPPRFNNIARARTGHYVTGRTKALAFGGAKLVLNTLNFGEVRSVNCRLFEATACGGFVLSHGGPDISKFFDLGAEIVTFDGLTELKDAVLYYLDAHEERRAIAEAGQARAHRDHTYQRRLREILRVTKLESRFWPTNTASSLRRPRPEVE